MSVAIGSSAVCLHSSVAGAMAAGATKDEIADVLLAIARVAGLGRVVSAAPEVATALEYYIDAAKGTGRSLTAPQPVTSAATAARRRGIREWTRRWQPEMKPG